MTQNRSKHVNKMTGLEVTDHHILEVACLITDSELNIVAEGPDLIIHQSDEILQSMNGWSKEHHGQTLRLLEEAYGEAAMKKTEVYAWHKRFSGGRDSIKDDVRSGRPTTVTNEAIAQRVRNITALDHPPYSPDLSPPDYFLFPRLKSHLKGRRFNAEEVIANATRALRRVSRNGFQELYTRWQKLSSTQKFLVQQHITTSKHQANKQLNSKQRQLFLTQPTTSNVRSEFNIDLCRSLISADIPLYKLKNKVFREFLEKYTQHTIPDESTLRKTYAPSIYDETIQKIRDEIKDSSIWVSIDETPDKEGRLVGNVVIGLLSEQYSERILLHCDVLEKCNNKTIVKLFNEAMGILWPKGIMYDNVLFFISDAAPYMVKAGQALSVVYPKLTHFTCVAHAFHRVAEVSGLTTASKNSKITIEDAEKQLLDFLKTYIPPGKCPLAGNSVYMDRTFMRRYLPQVDNYLHYRIVDVSTVKELCRRWCPSVYAKAPTKVLSHRALSDIKESVTELQYYKSSFLKADE
ncbi:hypothetical protein ANN_25360 [Periplaneta americana]|uniref:Exonuclease domain-containing protein n=1 Tax=Periplaneta americana TaxID=6978 RepID=A0ABQ8S144_PERAM|nr:hypothetical protein ANN_25360 [Periplaneta americana]